MPKTCVLIFLFLVTFFQHVFIQAQDTSNKYWYSGELSLELTKKTSINFEEQIRYIEDHKDYDQSFTEISLKHELSKIFSIAPAFRYSVRPEDDNRRRFSLDLGAKLKKKKFPFELQLRLRYQNTIEENSNKEFNYLRHKAELEYKINSDWNAFAATEYFFRFDRRNDWRGRRYTVGLSYEIKKRMDLKLFYRVDEDINVNNPERSHILGFGFSSDIKM